MNVLTTTNEKVTNSTDELILKTNQPPVNGTCQVLASNLSGLALDTYFKVVCSNWIDEDGYITFYKLYGNYLFK